ncbi:small subunit of acetolactate synthase-domain-containing protein [Hyaloraphidium curvatum]|nr:small subunit of acetolactate synthase-domain-containing protein [Hyaloraphidium curvatum]
MAAPFARALAFAPRLALGAPAAARATAASPAPAALLLAARTQSAAATFPRRRRRRLYPASGPPTAEQAVNNILYNTPPPNPEKAKRHILNCLVSNEPGVLSRVSGILAGRGFNIDSLVVAKTEVPDLSRMTIVLQGQDSQIEQARRQLEDLVPVWAVLDYTNTSILEREMLMVKVSTVPGNFPEELTEEEAEQLEEHGTLNTESPGISPLLSSAVQRDAIVRVARLFGGAVADVTHESVIIELCAKSSRVDAFLKLLKPYGIIEAARSGVMTMPRSMMDDLYDIEAEDEKGPAVDATMLPPG